MPTYVLFYDNGVPVRGSVQSGIHIGWSELAAFDLASSDRESPPRIWMLAKTTTPLAPRLVRAAARSDDGRGHADFESRFSGGVKVDSGLVDGSVRILSGSVDARSTGITAEVHFTSTHGGGELIVLRALVHGVRLVGNAPAARTGSDPPMEKITITYERITRPSAPRSSTDITAEVRGTTNSQLFRYNLDMTAEVGARQRAAYEWSYVLRRPGLLDIYDYPGDYAQRFDGVDKGGK